MFHKLRDHEKIKYAQSTKSLSVLFQQRQIQSRTASGSRYTPRFDSTKHGKSHIFPTTRTSGNFTSRWATCSSVLHFVLLISTSAYEMNHLGRTDVAMRLHYLTHFCQRRGLHPEPFLVLYNNPIPVKKETKFFCILLDSTLHLLLLSRAFRKGL